MATTDIYDEMDRRNLKLAAIDAATATPGGGGGLSDVPAAAPTGRSFGFRSGAAPAEGVAAQHLNLATAAGRELGEPTSFNAGAGAPEPVAVMRGTRTTFSPGQPEERQFALPEVATDLQARQAWNRSQLAREQGEVAGLPISPESKMTLAEAAKERFGEWRPAAQGNQPGQTLAEIAATREPPGTAEFRKAQTQKLQREEATAIREQNLAQFTKDWQGLHGQYDKSGVYQKPTDPNVLRDKAAAAEIAQTQNPKAGLEHFGERQLARKWLQTQSLPENFDAHPYLSEVYKNPAAWTELMKRAGTFRKLTTGFNKRPEEDFLAGRGVFTPGP